MFRIPSHDLTRPGVDPTDHVQADLSSLMEAKPCFTQPAMRQAHLTPENTRGQKIIVGKVGHVSGFLSQVEGEKRNDKIR
jgi:hypothetical protein